MRAVSGGFFTRVPLIVESCAWCARLSKWLTPKEEHLTIWKATMQAESFSTSDHCQTTASAENLALASGESPRLEQFLDRARTEGYQVEHQAAWPNGAGWIALAQQSEGETRVGLMINYYPDHTFTSRTV